MAYSDACITIHLIHDITDNKMDDKIHIVKNLETGDFELTYTDQNNGAPVTHKVSNMYREYMTDYLYMLFKNQALDEERYKHVQLTLPAMPRIIVSGKKFKDVYYRQHFLDTISNSLDMFDDITSLTKKTVRRPSSAPLRPSYGYETPVSRRQSMQQPPELVRGRMSFYDFDD